MKNLGFHCQRLSHLQEGVLGNGLGRGEFYNFPPSDLATLKREILSHDLVVSIHAPLVRTEWYPDPPTWSFLCDMDKENRELTLKMIRAALEEAPDFGAEYVVVHFPVPTTDSAGSGELEGVAWRSCDRLAEMGEKYHLPIHIEGVGPSPFLSIDFLSRALDQYPNLHYCFDTGHMNIAAHHDGFDLYEFAQGLAPYVGSIHLWNSRSFDDYLEFHHIPVHPSQRPEEGWADIGRILETLGDPHRPSIFESGYTYPRALGDYDYRDGVKWVKELLGTSS